MYCIPRVRQKKMVNAIQNQLRDKSLPAIEEACNPMLTVPLHWLSFMLKPVLKPKGHLNGYVFFLKKSPRRSFALAASCPVLTTCQKTSYLPITFVSDVNLSSQFLVCMLLNFRYSRNEFDSNLNQLHQLFLLLARLQLNGIYL